MASSHRVYESDGDAVRRWVGSLMMSRRWRDGEIIGGCWRSALADVGGALRGTQGHAGYQFLDPVSAMPTEIFYGPVYEQLPFAPAEASQGTGPGRMGWVTWFIS
ncbi:MAG: hypothetical protein CM15mP74_09300 [Halieaceae bacterium]|nr:MAG: hypothetical protein CM15mP74_09300 [Halieaceae bacterium]